MKVAATTAILLWALTIAIGGYFFVRGNTVTGTDGRQAVVLTSAERDHVLGEMRGLLLATANITNALARCDTAAIAKNATEVGMRATKDSPVTLVAKLPLEFKKTAFSVHVGFDAIASAANSGASTQKLTAMLADQLAICSGCHAGYRFSN